MANRAGKEKEYVSMPINGKLLLLHQLKKGDVLLFLYGRKIDRYPTYNSFIKTGLENNELCFYAYDVQEHRWHPELVFKKYIDFQQFQLLPLEHEPISKLDSKLKLMYGHAKSKNNSLRLLIDFGRTIDSAKIDDIISYDKEIIKKSKEFSSICVTALDIDSLSYDKLSCILKLHDKIAFFTPQDVGMALTFSGVREVEEVPIELMSLESVESFVKKNLETIVLSILQERPLCGYDLIKTILNQYHVFLSQGTVYPLLYSLTQQGLLETRQETKAKVYSPTVEGGKIIQNKLEEFRRVHEFMLSSFEKRSKI
ncbi:MAG: PadR family transcriptional regulator [Candidatus Thermoplasmatota archaeon]